MQIYKITNNQNGKTYIGKDKTDNEWYMGSGLVLWASYRKRFKRADLDGNKKTHHKWVYQQNQIYKFYEKTIIHACDDESQLCELEKYYIKKYNTIRPNGYNIADGGEGGHLVAGYTKSERKNLNKRISKAVKEAMNRPEVRIKFLSSVCNKDEEWRKHISESLTGRKGTPMTEENKEKLRQRSLGNTYGVGNKSRTGYHNSEEMNRRISESQKKIVHTEEWNKKVSESLKGKPKSESHKAALRKPKPKYKWRLPDGSIRIMDGGNGSRHQDWIKIERIE